jgi:hypothetical protein
MSDQEDMDYDPDYTLRNDELNEELTMPCSNASKHECNDTCKNKLRHNKSNYISE